jgi:hypothetical protein
MNQIDPPLADQTSEAANPASAASTVETIDPKSSSFQVTDQSAVIREEVSDLVLEEASV